MPPAKKNTDTEPQQETRPQDDPGYKDAGQAYADKVNQEQAEAEKAE